MDTYDQRHNAYRRLDQATTLAAQSDRYRPARQQVCEQCHSWPSCCFCTADIGGMRDALRRIAELHSGCEESTCPERTRLAAIPRVPTGGHGQTLR